jgi:hypothetical protein
MKYYVIYTSNGDLAISEIKEYGNLNSAKAQFHNTCGLLWADATTSSGFVAILDNQMNQVQGYYEGIVKSAQA